MHIHRETTYSECFQRLQNIIWKIIAKNQIDKSKIQIKQLNIVKVTFSISVKRWLGKTIKRIRRNNK